MAAQWEIRAYQAQDIHAVLHVFNRAIYKIAKRFYQHEQLDAWAASALDLLAWQERLATGITLVAVHQPHTVIGFVRAEHQGLIDLLYVLPQYEHQGVAKALYAAIEHKLQQHRQHHLTTQASAAAKEFFLRHGFVIDSTETVVRQGIGLVTYQMSKEVA